MSHSRDLFDNSTMTFGEHLEALRIHLWKAVIGLFLCVLVSLHPTVATNVIGMIRMPLDNALAKHGITDSEAPDYFGAFRDWAGGLFGGQREEAPPPTSAGDDPVPPAGEQPGAEESVPNPPRATTGNADLDALWRSVDALRAELAELREGLGEQIVQVEKSAVDRARLSPVSLNVQEPFLIYLKVAFVTGLVLASPWIFYQLWLFVAAGLYPHERKYVYIYMPLSLGLFATGALFCFFAVFPFVLTFLLGFNTSLGIEPNIRMSEWISFAIMLPLMFGLSFELPLVMLFLERISIFEVHDYREKRRMAILVIAIVSMFMTPADPMSMIMMMVPLLLLYELGILMCRYSPSKSPFGMEAA